MYAVDDETDNDADEKNSGDAEVTSRLQLFSLKTTTRAPWAGANAWLSKKKKGIKKGHN